MASSRDPLNTDLAHTVCLGCGCACDDIHLIVRGGLIVEARSACALGSAWFGDGHVPMHARVDGREAPLDEAVAAAARLLAGARRPLVYLAPDLTCEALREAVGLADRLRATLDSVTSATALASILAAQERGRATATLGEIRHRADVVVFWATDPAARYPRFTTRYAPDAWGLHVAEGRRSRTVVAVDVGDWSGPADADLRIALEPREEVQALTWLAASFTDRRPAPSSTTAGIAPSLDALAATLGRARYVALVADADEATPARDPGQAAAFAALGQAINRRTRAATLLLRGGGNRSAADAVMTAQTGYPMAVDFSRGFPEYRPYDGTAAARLSGAEVDAVFLAGSAAHVPSVLRSALTGVRCAVVGPRASAELSRAHVIVDTGVAGIHDGGTAMRMDDVPLPLRPVMAGPPSAEHVLRLLRQRIDTV